MSSKHHPKEMCAMNKKEVVPWETDETKAYLEGERIRVQIYGNGNIEGDVYFDNKDSIILVNATYYLYTGTIKRVFTVIRRSCHLTGKIEVIEH